MALAVMSTVDSIFMIGRSVQINAVMIQKASKTPRMALIVARTLSVIENKCKPLSQEGGFWARYWP